ncbi:MAG: hypothetical protein GXO75_15940 [Calditrichaeota bacterium]|nr:hypothetical protein [Calditrichota bacterium]
MKTQACGYKDDRIKNLNPYQAAFTARLSTTNSADYVVPVKANARAVLPSLRN